MEQRAPLRPEDVARAPLHGPPVPVHRNPLHGPPSREAPVGASTHPAGATSPSSSSTVGPHGSSGHGHGGKLPIKGLPSTLTAPPPPPAPAGQLGGTDGGPGPRPGGAALEVDARALFAGGHSQAEAAAAAPSAPGARQALSADSVAGAGATSASSSPFHHRPGAKGVPPWQRSSSFGQPGPSAAFGDGHPQQLQAGLGGRKSGMLVPTLAQQGSPPPPPAAAGARQQQQQQQQQRGARSVVDDDGASVHSAVSAASEPFLRGGRGLAGGHDKGRPGPAGGATKMPPLLRKSNSTTGTGAAAPAGASVAQQAAALQASAAAAAGGAPLVLPQVPGAALANNWVLSDGARSVAPSRVLVGGGGGLDGVLQTGPAASKGRHGGGGAGPQQAW